MAQWQSGFDTPYLLSYVQRIREIAAMNDDDAIVAFDAFLHYVLCHQPAELETIEMEWSETSRHRIMRLTQMVERSITHNEAINIWTILRLIDYADTLEAQWDDMTRNDLADIIRGHKEQAYRVAHTAGNIYYTRHVEELATKPIHNIVSVQNLLREIDHVEQELHKRGLLDDALVQRIRVARERAAWYRTRKRLAERDIAGSSGRVMKARHLEREAATLLAHDWGMAFPSIPVPPVAHGGNDRLEAVKGTNP